MSWRKRLRLAADVLDALAGSPNRAAARWLWNVRRGRMQRSLSLATALSVPPLGFEIYMEHFKGSFGDKWMWTPIALTPPRAAACSSSPRMTSRHASRSSGMS